LGPDCVSLYALPTKFNSQQSYIDAKMCAENLKINLQVIDIEPIFTQFLQSLQNQHISALATENLQARIRGNVLMAIANSSNALLLSTGNKSELACGYATLYGDMCGGFNPIADFYKTTIYELANWRNNNLCHISKNDFLNIIPANILQKEPSAELRPNQKDSDSLPPYDILDKILYALVEEQKSVLEVANLGFSLDLVKQVAKMLYRNEFKRQQATIGLKTSDMCFNLDWLYPISNYFKD
ncbi:MAG: NAD(+) synthase, partial [Proteobacteria bacterium]|nr:NAD(+) synthase [Pseudomonadota bacterium]